MILVAPFFWPRRVWFAHIGLLSMGGPFHLPVQPHLCISRRCLPGSFAGWLCRLATCAVPSSVFRWFGACDYVYSGFLVIDHFGFLCEALVFLCFLTPRFGGMSMSCGASSLVLLFSSAGRLGVLTALVVSSPFLRFFPDEVVLRPAPAFVPTVRFTFHLCQVFVIPVFGGVIVSATLHPWLFDGPVSSVVLPLCWCPLVGHTMGGEGVAPYP